MGKVYTGIGSRKIGKENYAFLFQIGKKLKEQGWIVRSGGAQGADSAFGEADPLGEHYVPWRNFAVLKNLSEINVNQFKRDILEKAAKIAAEHHKKWDSLSSAVQLLHTRNVFQIFGRSLDSPSKMVIFWAPEEKGEVVGGTGQAIRIARSYNIPTYNTYFSETKERLQKWLDS